MKKSTRYLSVLLIAFALTFSWSALPVPALAASAVGGQFQLWGGFFRFVGGFFRIGEASPTPPMLGITLNGGEAGFNVPTATDLSKLHSYGVRLVRLPLMWERLQNVRGGALDATGYLTSVQSFCTTAWNTYGIKVILDVHNYGRYRDGAYNNGSSSGATGSTASQNAADNSVTYAIGGGGATFTGSIAGTTLSIPGGVTNGPLTAGMYLTGAGITANTQIVSGSGTTWTVNNSQTVASEAMAANAVTQADFTDFWTKMATAFVGNVGVAGYELINEPHNMPGDVLTFPADFTNGTWAPAAQAAITAIRTVDTVTPIYVDGNQFAGPGWFNPPSSAYNFPKMADASNHVIYVIHDYIDGSGGSTMAAASCSTCYNAAGLNSDSNAQKTRLLATSFPTWLTNNGLTYANAILGEFGDPWQDTRYTNTQLANWLPYAKSIGLVSIFFTYSSRTSNGSMYDADALNVAPIPGNPWAANGFANTADSPEILLMKEYF
jgi:aryl-phospho-beta-D-glucosidase BglC (GH1 family)